MRIAIEILASLLLVGGGAIVAFAAVGVARLTDPFMRMHAAAKAGAMGAGLLVLGAGLAIGTAGAVLTALAAVAFILLTAPLASHALGRAAYVAGAPLGAASVADALSGVLDRKVFDIDPARTARPRPARFSPSTDPSGKDPSMSATPEFRWPGDAARRGAATARQAQAAAEPAAIRRILCGLVGGPAQPAATATAIDLARGAGAQLVGLSGLGQAPRRWQGPVGIGGAYWAEWAEGRSRARLRQDAAVALQAFQEAVAALPGLEAEARHEEADPRALAMLLAGHDLVVLPAGAGPHGLPCDPAEEVAAAVARARIAPVLRVARRPGVVREVVMLVGAGDGCGALAAGLLRSGLWPEATVSILALGEDRPAVRAMADGQAALLRAHGRQVAMLPALEPDFEAPALRARIARYDAAVMSCLTTRQGGVFDSLRICAHEIAGETAPLTLLP